jgi:hypothetical protein
MARSWSCILVKPAPTDTIIITVVASDNTNEVVVDAAAAIRSARATFTLADGLADLRQFP